MTTIYYRFSSGFNSFIR